MFDPVDLAKMRATDAKGKTRVFLPKPGTLKFEMELEIKIKKYLKNIWRA